MNEVRCPICQDLVEMEYISSGGNICIDCEIDQENQDE